MRQRFLAVLLLAATTLPSCSEEPNAFIGKSPGEIASSLVFGLKDGSELVTANETMTAHVATAQPFTIAADAARGSDKMEFLRIVATKTGACMFTFDMNPKANHPARVEATISVGNPPVFNGALQ